MKKILVLGGTQFFGQKAVEKLVKTGFDVTIATRGNNPNPFGDQVRHIILDRQDAAHPGWDEITQQEWDGVFDNICYTYDDAKLLIDKLTGLTKHLYFTSTLAVYEGDQNGYVEADFDPYSYEIDFSKKVTYGEGKRQAEALLHQEAPFAVTSFRLPIVLDQDDYTERLHFYIKQIQQEKIIYFNNPIAMINFVKGSTAAAAIHWAIAHEQIGIFNISSKDAISIETLITWLEEGIGKPAEVETKAGIDFESPFNLKHNRYLISDKIEKAGFNLMRLEEWLKPLIEELAGESKN